MMGYFETFTPGNVSDPLREALGFGNGNGRNNRAVDYPWFDKIRQFGYPPGFITFEGTPGGF